MLERLATACHRRRRWGVGGWGLAALGGGRAGGGARPPFDKEFPPPGTDSQQAYDLLARHFPDQATGTGQVVLHAPAGLNSPAMRPRVLELLHRLATADRTVSGVVGPEDARDGGLPSRDGQTGVALIRFSTPRTGVPRAAATRLEKLAADASHG